MTDSADLDGGFSCGEEEEKSSLKKNNKQLSENDCPLG